VIAISSAVTSTSARALVLDIDKPDPGPRPGATGVAMMPGVPARRTRNSVHHGYARSLKASSSISLWATTPPTKTPGSRRTRPTTAPSRALHPELDVADQILPSVRRFCQKTQKPYAPNFEIHVTSDASPEIVRYKSQGEPTMCICAPDSTTGEVVNKPASSPVV